jgi:hypothetical protein
MKKVISSLVVASCTVIAATSAWACEPMHKGQPCGKFFEEMDVNHDGTLSKKEFDVFHNKHFKEMDANHDGKVTQEEMQAVHSKMHGGDSHISKRFDASDIDHDGAISRDEAKSMPMLSQHFDEIDANKDGKVTQEELKAMMEDHRAAGGPGNGQMMGKETMMPEKK